jgi:hypothetical protein
MAGKSDHRTLGCVVPASLYERAKTRAQEHGLRPSTYLRKLVIQDIRESDQYARELGVTDVALLAACLSVARQIIGSVDEETLIRLSRDTAHAAKDDR